jgi:hypothetical protein
VYKDLWQENVGSELHYPRDITVSPNREEVYVCAGGSDAFAVLSRSPDGTISSPVSAIDGEDRLMGLDGIRWD